MGKLRPIGSEKLQGIEKLNRIMEIARYREHLPNPVNENSSKEYKIVLADGNEYSIDREKNGYVIKKRIDESTFEYLEPMKNRNYYRSYSQAFKRLNLITKEINTLVGNENEISLFSEQKYVLKTPKPAAEPAPEPLPAPEEPMPTGDETTPSPEGEMGSEEMPSPEGEMGSEEMPSPEGEMGMEEPMDSEEGADASFKGIQKLTGKLAQKLRTSDEEEMTPDNIKYVLNSILSAIDVNKLEDEDKEEIMNRLEGDESEEEGGEMPSEEPMDMGSEDLGMEEPAPPTETEESELYEISDSNMDGSISKKLASSFAAQSMNKLGKFENEDREKEFYENIFDGVFNESKVEKVLTKYFKINESEKKEIQRKKIIQENIKKRNVKLANMEIERLCESNKQENTAKELIKKYPQAKVIGLTNMKNLVIEHKGSQVKITPKGTIL